MDPVTRALDHVRSRSSGAPVPTNHRVTLNFHPDTLAGGLTTIECLLRDGVYRSQFETGTSNGGMTAHPGGDRWLWESRIFGGAYDTSSDLSLRPKYGALNYRADPVGGSRRFGSCHLRLRPGIMARTTYCYPDSYWQPENFGVGDRMALIDIARQNDLGLDPLDDYIEAHVHGPVRLAEDVEAVVLDASYRNTPMQDVAQRLPCALEWHEGFRLAVDQLVCCENYRGRQAAEAVAAMMDTHGVLTPMRLGSARLAGIDYQLTKWAWHCVARFGMDRPVG